MSNSVNSILSPFLEKHEPARGLPAAAYTEEQFWKTECETVLAQNWVCAGFAHELPEPGDSVPTTIAGKPVLLIKNQKGRNCSFSQCLPTSLPYTG